MYCIIASLVLVAVATASPAIQTRQDCNGLTPPQRCTEALAQFNSRLGMITGGAVTLKTEQLREIRQAYLDALPTVCSAECLNTLIRAGECAAMSVPGATSLANFTRNGICGQDEGVYCAVRLIDVMIMGGQTSIAPTCASGGTCNADCKMTVSSLRSQLGCCTGSWYGGSDQGFAPLSTYANQFTSCNVTIGAACSGAGMRYLSVTLLFAAAVLAMIIS